MAVDKINNFVDFCQKIPSLEFDGERYVCDEKYNAELSNFSIPFEEFGNSLRIKIKTYFEGQNLKYYEVLDSEIKSNEISISTLLVSSKGAVIKFDAIENSFTEYGKTDEGMLLKFKNIIAYFKLFNFLKSDTFCDYYNDANNEIVVYSSVNGIIKIKYKPIPTIVEKADISLVVPEIIKLASPIQITSFFKNSLFKVSNGTGILSIDEILQQNENVITITKRDYELVSKQFDFDKFQDSLYKEKEKYFSSLRELINKIFGQAVGIPISISSSVFVTYKVADDVFMLLLVLISFILYTLFYIKIQLVYRFDLLEIEKDFKNSFEIIGSKSGLDIDIINLERQKIVAKIQSTKRIFFWLIFLVILLGLLVVTYIVYQIIYCKTMSLLQYFS